MVRRRETEDERLNAEVRNAAYALLTNRERLAFDIAQCRHHLEGSELTDEKRLEFEELIRDAEEALNEDSED